MDGTTGSLQVAGKKRRGKVFIPQEDKILLSVAEKYLHVLLNKNNSKAVTGEKNAAWIEITDKFNLVSPLEKRSIESLKMRWDNMKKTHKIVTVSDINAETDDTEVEDALSGALRMEVEALEKAADDVDIIEMAMPLSFSNIDIPNDTDSCDRNGDNASKIDSPLRQGGEGITRALRSRTSCVNSWKRRSNCLSTRHDDEQVVSKKRKPSTEDAVSEQLEKYFTRKSEMERQYLDILKMRLRVKFKLEAQDRARKLTQEDEEIDIKRKYAVAEEQRKIELHTMQMQLLKAELNNISQNS